MSQNPYAGGPQPGYEAWHEQPSESSLSIMSVLSLIFSILCLTAPLGIILGVASLFTIGASGGRKHGKGLAISGIVIGLVFSTCMTFTIVGGLGFVQMMQTSIALPNAQVMLAIEDKDYVKARAGMAPSLAAVVTDEQLDDFRDTYQAELGKFKGTSNTAWELISNYTRMHDKSWDAFAKNQPRGGQNNVIPLVMEFEKGPGIVAVKVRGDDGKPENLTIFTNGGSAIWLIDTSGRGVLKPPPPVAPPPTESTEPTTPPPSPRSGG